MQGICCTVDQVGTRTVVRIDGELSVAAVPQLRATLLKCLVARPDAVIVELAELRVREPVALSVFAAVARQAAMWPGTPLLLSGPSAEVARWFAAERSGQVSILPTTAAALDLMPGRQMPWLADSLLPVSGAAAHARRLAARACARWNLPELADPARIVAGELVTNAVVHAQTMIDLRFSLGRRYLLVAVRDGSYEVPRTRDGSVLDPAAPRGLFLVERFAKRWGTVPADGGKVVWANLRR
ncbi:STAS domain-containing protein [Actinoplanes sp. L3-i22]|uniref:ATP-binding protein n=1 Tax=Actinoplanes sp. L3-i22 TaxID=2836373 RepID=UPI001C8611A8|nr:STAS domain-containing protein [Actinoplanes sp. L3-i22]